MYDMKSLLLVLVLGQAVLSVTAQTHKIEHVVVLMLENRSFDHLLGFLKQSMPDLDGLDGDETNPVDPTDPTSGTVQVSQDAEFIIHGDPSHSHSSTDQQQYGYGDPTDPAPMSGFVKSYEENSNNDGSDIMKCFAPEKLETLTALAQEFGVIDNWFSSIPGPTQVNRMYIHSATSQGTDHNPSNKKYAAGFTQESIFRLMSDNNHTWRCYFAEAPSMIIMRDTREPRYWKNYRPMEMFEKDCMEGNLPDYTWVEPRWFDWLYNFPASDEHPPHDVKFGEYLVAHIYKKLRAGPKWNSTLFLVTYDEHGGFYDHVSPPQSGVPNPDGLVAEDGFDFTRLGVRVPAVVASPYIKPGTVFHGAPTSASPTATSQFDHSSLPATLKKLFNLPKFLTERDAWANTFDFVVDDLDEPRTDCPTTLPTPPRRTQSYDEWEAALVQGPTEENIRKGIEHGGISREPVTELQEEILAMISGAAAFGDGEELEKRIQTIENLGTEYEAAEYAREATATFLRRLRERAGEE